MSVFVSAILHDYQNKKELPIFILLKMKLQTLSIGLYLFNNKVKDAHYRKEQICLGDVPDYHCICSCVHRAFYVWLFLN